MSWPLYLPRDTEMLARFLKARPKDLQTPIPAGKFS